MIKDTQSPFDQLFKEMTDKVSRFRARAMEESLKMALEAKFDGMPTDDFLKGNVRRCFFTENRNEEFRFRDQVLMRVTPDEGVGMSFTITFPELGLKPRRYAMTVTPSADAWQESYPPGLAIAQSNPPATVQSERVMPQ